MQAQSIYQQAHAQGLQAVQNAIVTPMVVTQKENPLNDSSDTVNQWFVSDGVCGFASVIVKPANSKFANYLKNNGLGRKHYYGGFAMPIRDFNQSLQKKEAYAHAFARVLNQNGIDAYVDSRMD